MTQNWRRLGLIHQPDRTKWWAVNGYCHLPTAITLFDKDVVRVYYASLDMDMRGRVGYVDLDTGDLERVVAVSPKPVMDIGPAGAFDCDGVTPSCIVPFEGRLFMHYIGWQRTARVPYMLFGGVAKSMTGGASFERTQDVPVMDRTIDEPYSRSAPFVMIEDGVFRAWYWSCTHWSDGHYNNVIMHTREGEKPAVCLTPEAPDYALGRPWVIKEQDIYRMWYSIRREGNPEYRMGYAQSHDGLKWVRFDQHMDQLNESGNGETSEYPCVIDSGGKRWMLFNGRKHGADGIQLAVLDD